MGASRDDDVEDVSEVGTILAAWLMLVLCLVALDAEFNSLSNGARFNRGNQQKTMVSPQIPGFSPTSIDKPCPDSLNNMCWLLKWLCWKINIEYDIYK